MDCGACTLCCTLCVVEELDKAAGVACNHCATGCTIYDKRPQSCRDLQCAYRQAQTAHIATRPDNLGVVFEKLADDLIFGTVDPSHSGSRHLQGQIKAFLSEGINVVLVKNGISTTYHLDNVSPNDILGRVYRTAS